jgi:hypothetical protein
MKLFKNKIFLLILSSIFLLFSLQFYFISNSYKRDTNSYVMLVEWSWLLTTSGKKEVLKLNSKIKISDGDVIHTLSKSLAIIEWGDKSITRLWENSKIIVKENFISEDLSKINISFELLKWKTWSNVVSIFARDSYFKQDIKWVSAAVRWTVFEANYDNDYMVVHKHAVSLTNSSGETKEIYPWDVFSLKTFSIEQIKVVIDEAFQKLNNQLDDEYIKSLRQNFLNSLNDSNPLNLVSRFSDENKVLTLLSKENSKQEFEKYLSNIDEEKKQKILNYVNTLSQSVNFENWEDWFLYNLKLNTRENLIENTENEDYKKTLIRYSVYDLSDMLTLWNLKQDLFDNTLKLISPYKDYIQSQSGVLSEKNNLLKEVLLLNPENINIENLKSKISNLDKTSQEILNNWLNKLLDLYK